MRTPFVMVLAVLAVTAVGFSAPPAWAGRAATIEEHAREALQILYDKAPGTKALADSSAAVLVFPKIVKAGLIVGGQYGEGALFKEEALGGYYSSGSLSFGFEAGIQTYAYALFFADDAALDYLDQSDGWEIGTAPNVVVVDLGAAASLSTTSARGNIHVFFFDQKGIMAGLSIVGSKISIINPK